MIRVLEATVSLLGCTRIRKQDVGDVREELTGRSGNGTDIGQTLDRGVAVQKEDVALLRESGSVHLAGTVVPRAMKGGKEDDRLEMLKGNELSPWTRVKLQGVHP